MMLPAAPYALISVRHKQAVGYFPYLRNISGLSFNSLHYVVIPKLHKLHNLSQLIRAILMAYIAVHFVSPFLRLRYLNYYV